MQHHSIAVALLCLCLLARQHAAAPTSAAACAPDDGPNGRLYWMDTSAEVGTWDQGKAYCNSLHGWAADVAKVDNEVQFALLKDLITKLPGATGAWIFNKWNQSGADMPGGPYMEWCPGEPDKPEEHQCAAYLLKCEQDPSRSGLMSVACSDKYTTMCSRDHSCTNGLPTAEKCVGSKRFILHAEQGMTALSAQLFCKQRYGGSARLAEILTVEEMAAVKELSLAAPNNNPWVGLYKSQAFSNSSKFALADGRLPQPEALNWCPGEPNNQDSSEECTLYSKGCMNDVGCEHDKMNVLPAQGLICSVESGTCGSNAPGGSSRAAITSDIVTAPSASEGSSSSSRISAAAAAVIGVLAGVIVLVVVGFAVVKHRSRQQQSPEERLAPGSSSISLPTRSSGPASVAITMPGEASAGGSPMKAIPSKYYTLREEGNTI